ncbi:transporter, major facilitator family [Neocallimastix californiae]|jgi:OFA family oxalate/formate antiporter-like MFS transporter|uniref:Transporter, major facilitator family n=1 Tax=Neocallimastix californiae TaxID=1754190 RepID=A0A1Y2AF00_9FUNG|nr:transporter, major facilitator family [Neocallimastix californiae]|eukprot:ORY21173.1 transporter, major facilitator family [Neocallimastix californiae]
MKNKVLDSIVKIAGCGIPIFWAGVISFGYPGVMSSYWQEKFHVGNTETGLVLTFMLLALALVMFFTGRIHAKIGMAYCILIGTAFYLIAFIILYFAKSIYWVYVWAFTVNLGCSFVYGPGLTTVQQAFPTRKGLVSGIINLLFGISAAALSPILNALLNHQGYNFVNLLTISIMVISNMVAFLLVKIYIREDNRSQQKANSLHDMTVKESLKTKEFWLIWFVWIFMGASGISMITLSKSYATEIGKPGVSILTTFNLANGLFRIVVGWLSDKIGARITGALAFFLTTIGYLVMPHTSNLLIVCIGTIGVGIGFGALFTISGPLAADIFGLTNFGMIYGIIFTAYGLVAGVVGPAISGMILEKTNNNYTIVFSYLGGMAFLGTLLIYCINDKKRKTDTNNTDTPEMKKSETEKKDINDNDSIMVEIECQLNPSLK